MAKRKLPQTWVTYDEFSLATINWLGEEFLVAVSCEDTNKVANHRWCINNCGYAITTSDLNGVKKGTLMHRLILGATPEQEIDHKSRNPLDNRRSNIRFCTRSQNLMNVAIRNDNKVGLKGVWFDKQRNKYQAYINVDGKRKHLGRYEEKSAAGKAYDDAAINLFGVFAKTNQSMGLI